MADKTGALLSALDDKKLTWFHFKILFISGMGFFTDSYDLFSISLLTPLIGRLYYQDNPFHINNTVDPGKLPLNLSICLSVVALIGSSVGQVTMGYVGDRLGRTFTYGLCLVTMIVCAFCQSMSFGSTPDAVIGTLAFWRFCLGYGVGGDYPLSAIIMSEFSGKSNRGALVAAIFSMQGFGILAAAAVSAIVVASFSSAYPAHTYPLSVPGCASWAYQDAAKTIVCPMANREEYWSQVQRSCPREYDFVWRIVLCFGALPASLSLYLRSKLKESPRYTAHTQQDSAQALKDLRVMEAEADAVTEVDSVVAEPLPAAAAHKKTSKYTDLTLAGFFYQFRTELFITASTWFLLDVAFYSQNLFQSNVFTQVGWLPPAKYMNAIEEAGQTAKAQAIIALGSTIPGYFATVFTVDIVGRKPIQIMGFFFMTLFMFILAGTYWQLLDPNSPHNTEKSRHQPQNKNGWIAMYAFCFFFANFGPNATTFIVPAELFPTRFRGTGHGFAAGMGKLGAIIGSVGFVIAALPARYSTTWNFPCNQSGQYDGVTGACLKKNDCPAGRRQVSSVLGSYCACLTDSVIGCYPFGIGIVNALYILAATNCLGLIISLYMPETMNKSLEQLNDDQVQEYLNEDIVAVEADDKGKYEQVQTADRM